jgi:phosphopantothenoylcysteine decarboxylase/phosphopantothenate--cysteine ligase
MARAVLDATADADALIMAAAVADFRPAQEATQKIKKESGVPTLTLAPNPDILMEVAEARAERGRPTVVVGFAAETENLLQNAQSKLARKGLSLIVANDVSASDAGFGVDTNRVTILQADGTAESLPLLAKSEVAARIIQRVAEAFDRRTPSDESSFQ